MIIKRKIFIKMENIY